MIEKDFVKKALVATAVKEEIMRQIGKRAKVSSISIERTPLGEKVTIRAQQPGLVIGHGGEIVKGLTEMLRNTYKFENPQIEITDVQKPMLSAQLVANSIAAYLERFGTMRFKAIGHKMLLAVIKEGALGAEIKLGGKLPSEKAKSWRFFYGYLNKCGEVAKEQVDYASAQAMTKPGTVGIKVWIMAPNVELSDRIIVKVAPKKVEVKEAVVKIEEAPKIKSETKEKLKEERGERKISNKSEEKKFPKVKEGIVEKTDTQKSQMISDNAQKSKGFLDTSETSKSQGLLSVLEIPKEFPRIQGISSRIQKDVKEERAEKKVSKKTEKVDTQKPIPISDNIQKNVVKVEEKATKQ